MHCSIMHMIIEMELNIEIEYDEGMLRSHSYNVKS
jgi:hypothetical protein